MSRNIYTIIWIIGVILGVAYWIFDIFSKDHKEALYAKYPRLKYYILAIVTICVLIGGYKTIREIVEKQTLSIFVSPKEYIVGAGREEVFIMKVTNNKDIPLYGIQVNLEIISGPISTDNITLKPLKNSLIKEELGDEKGKVIILFDNIILHRKKENKEYPTIMNLIINNLSAHTSIDYAVNVDAEKHREPSSLTITVAGYSVEPQKIIKKNASNKSL